MTPKNLPHSISKVNPPHLHNVLQRPRLFKRLDESRETKLFLILGQGAQGKSTLVASYLEWSKLSYAWINLGPEDSDPVNLFLILIQAVQTTLPRVALTRLVDLAGISLGPREPIPMYHEWASAFYKHIPVDYQIGLDGLDNLSADAASYLFLSVLLEETPPGVRLLMMSRSAPSLDLEHLQTNDEVIIIENAELAFTLEEAEILLREVQGVSITNAQVKVVHQLSEGWAGGLILMCETVNRSKDALTNIQEVNLGIGGLRNRIFQYFTEQVFNALPGQIQDFLVKTSMFDVMEPGIITSFIDVQNTEPILRELSLRNLFVSFYRTHGNNGMFRYHQLFMDFLRTKFETVLTAPERKDLMLKAAGIFETKGDLETALGFCLEVKEYQRAASILERIGVDILKEGRTGDVARWLKRFPPDHLTTNPWLLTFLCITRGYTACQSNIEDLTQSIIIFQERNDIRGHLLALRHLIENKTTLFLYDPGLIKEGEELIASLNSDEYPYESSLLLQMIGFAYNFRGNPKSGLLACQKSYKMATRIKNPILQASALIYTISPLSLLGDFGEVEKVTSKIERLLNRIKSDELWTSYYFHYCNFLMLRGAMEPARELIQKLLKDIQKQGLVYLVPVILFYKLTNSVFIDDHPTVEQESNQLLSLIPEGENFFLRAYVEYFLGVSAYQNENYNLSIEIIDKSIKNFSTVLGRAEVQLQYAKLMRGMLDYHLNEVSLWEDDLDKAGEYFEKIQSKLFLAQYHLAKALLSWKKGDYSRAALFLKTGFREAEKLSCNYFIVLNRSDKVKACALAIEMQVEPVLDYAASILSDRFVADAADELERLSRHGNPAVREKVETIRQTIHLNSLPRLRIKTLGGFRVWRNQTVMTDKDWGGSQSKMLLKAIVTHGSREVPKDVLTDSLWPEAPPAAAERNFKAALHRLRKAIEPEMKRDFGSSYITLADNIISMTDLVEHIDLEAFLAEADQGEDLEKRKADREALAHWDKALSIYSGEFLPADLYLPWIDEKREEMKRRYLDVLLRKARLHEKRGALRKAISAYTKAIDAEPTFEEAYRRLMTIHARLDRRNEALKIYHSCQQQLKEILNTEPDAATTSLFQRIKEDK